MARAIRNSRKNGLKNREITVANIANPMHGFPPRKQTM